jgi:hypothetical protein
MKNFDLNAYGVTEMSQQEMLSIDGGNIFKDAWNAICDAAETVWDWIKEHVRLGIIPSGGTISL